MGNCPTIVHTISSVRLSTRFDNEFVINHALSINFILKDIVKPLLLPSLSIAVISFYITTESVLYFSLFSPRHSNCSSNLFGNCLMMK